MQVVYGIFCRTEPSKQVINHEYGNTGKADADWFFGERLCRQQRR